MNLVELLDEVEKTDFYYSVGKNQAYHLLGYFAHMTRPLPPEECELNKYLESYRGYGKTKEEALEDLLRRYHSKDKKYFTRDYMND